MRRSYMYIWKSFGRNDTNAWIIIMMFRNIIMSGDPPTFVKIPEKTKGVLVLYENKNDFHWHGAKRKFEVIMLFSAL